MCIVTEDVDELFIVLKLCYVLIVYNQDWALYTHSYYQTGTIFWYTMNHRIWGWKPVGSSTLHTWQVTTDTCVI